MIEFFKSLSLRPSLDKLLEHAQCNPAELDWLRQISTKIHKNESAYLTDGGMHYLMVGLSAMSCIRRALNASRADRPSSILDFPCGYGRVMRFLKAAYPNARLAGTDLDSKAIQFCSRNFGARTFPSQRDFDKLQFNSHYDLIWCGSLVTHFDKANIVSLLRFLHRHLNPGGICIFTSHGIRVEDLLDRGEINYSLNPDQVDTVLREYRETGAGFSEYEPSRNGYGISLTSDATIRELAAEASSSWECLTFEPAGWDNHQDTYSFRKDVV